MATPTGATNYITITSTAAQVAASMPDVGSTFAADLVIDQAASINYEGGAETFIDGLAADYSDLRVTDSTGDITIPFGVKQFSQTAGSRKLIIGLGIPSTAPLLASGPVVYKLWRGATGGTAENRAGVAPTADGWVIYAPLSEQGPGTGTGTAVWRNWVTDTVTIKEYTTNTGKAGQVGAGQQFSGTGKATGPTIAWSTFSDYTIMCWFRLASDYSTYSQILGGTSWRPSISTDEAREINYWQSGGYTVAGIAVTSDVWHFAAVTHTTNVDSLIVDTTTQTGNRNDTLADRDMQIAGGGTAAVDEVQITSNARSANWLTTYYNMTYGNGAFWTVGAEQSLATPIAFPFRAANVSRWKLSGANGDRGFGLNAADIHRWRLS